MQLKSSDAPSGLLWDLVNGLDDARGQALPSPETKAGDDGLSVPQLALPEIARRHPEMLAEDTAEMREVVKAPGKRDLADMAVGEHG